MRSVPPDRAEVVPTELQPRIVDDRGDRVVGHRGPLELDEEQLVGDRRGAFLDVGEQRPPRRVGGVHREPQRRVRPGATDELTDRPDPLHEPGQLRRVERADPTAVLLKLLRLPLGVVEEPGDALVAATVDEGVEVPRDVRAGTIQIARGHQPILRCRDRRAAQRGRRQRLGQRVGVDDHQLACGAGERDVQQSQAGGVGAHEL